MPTWRGPHDAPALVILAPGDAGRATDAAPTLVATGLASAGLRVLCFDFPATESEDSAHRDTLLAHHIRALSAQRIPGQHLVLGGFSRGARVSCTLVEELGAVGLLGFAYPFHPRQSPDIGDRVVQLARLTVPALIFQGTRDSHGNRSQVPGYGLPPHVDVRWLEDANHALVPRPRSGQTQATQLTEAARIAADFIATLP